MPQTKSHTTLQVSASGALGPLTPEEALLFEKLDLARLPRHVAVIMDGNGRWAQQRHLPRAEIFETSSNARSAELAAKEKNTAAIGGILAAEKYKLQILEQDIQDNAANATRFLVLGRQCSPPTGDDRTSLMVSVSDKVGALHEAIAAFRKFKINMTKIESRPSKRKAWEYFFFIDCDGHAQDKKVAKAIQQLGKHCNFVKILGSYPNTD